MSKLSSMVVWAWSLVEDPIAGRIIVITLLTCAIVVIAFDYVKDRDGHAAIFIPGLLAVNGVYSVLLYHALHNLDDLYLRPAFRVTIIILSLSFLYWARYRNIARQRSAKEWAQKE